MGFKSEPFPKAGRCRPFDQPSHPSGISIQVGPFPDTFLLEDVQEKPVLFFLNRAGGEELDSSDSQKNHGNNPGEKDDIDEKSFHTILIGLSAPKVKFFLVL